MIELTNRQLIYTKKLLQCIAVGRKTIQYGELANLCGVSARSVGRDVGEISKLCHSLGLPPISGMVVNKDTGYADPDGFGGLCAEMGEYKEYRKDFGKLIDQCLTDIHSCKKWNVLADYLGLEIEGLPFDSEKEDPIASNKQDEEIEGERIQITATAYERNPENRVKCLRRWGTTCQICGFDAAKIYGEEFVGCIHVHHIQPLSEVGEAHGIDPEKDLIPVCPNCHMILHSKKDGVFTPDEVRAMLKREQ